MGGLTPDGTSLRQSARPLAWLAVFMTTGTLLVGFDAVVVERGLLTEGPPSSDPEYLLRAVIAAASSVALISGLRSIPTGSDATDMIPPPRTKRWMLAMAPGLALASAAVLLISPGTFTTLALEDHLVEDATVLFLIAAIVLLCMSIRRSLQSAPVARTLLLLPAGVAVALFLIAGEEISWGQRIFSIATPDAFGGNDQAELNLHNFATSRVENVYYFGAFSFLMLGPMIGAALRQVPEVLRPYVPSAGTAIGSAVAFGFAYDMWDISLTQISFFGSLAVLALWVPRVVDSPIRPLIAFVAVSTIAVQAALFLNGHAMGRIYDATEYRELFIPIGFFIYAVDVWRTSGPHCVNSPGRANLV